MESDFGLPCDTEPCEIIPFHIKPQSEEWKLQQLTKQLRKLELAKAEIERKERLVINIDVTREKIKALGEIPCA